MQARYLRLVRSFMGQVESLIEREVLPLAEARDEARVDAADEFTDVFARLNAKLGEVAKDLTPALTRIARDVTKHADREAQRTLAVDLRGADYTVDRVVRDFVRINVNLIRSVSFGQLERMRAIVDAHHAGQTSQAKLRDALMDTFELSRARANLIARDQILKTNADITQYRQEQVGVSEYVWVTSNDERVRGRPGGKWSDSSGDHWSLDGRTFRWSEPPVVDLKSGRRAHPGKDFQCRCVAVPVVDRLLGR